MTRDDIIRIAQECGLHLGSRPPLEPGLARFAALVAAAERKRDEVLLKQALGALETPIHEQPLGMRQTAIAALRERLGERK